MKILALIFGILALAIGVIGLIWPEQLIAIARHAATPVGVYVAAAVRVGLGLVLLLAAHASRAPNALRVFGVLILLAGVATACLGVARAQAMVEWLSAQGPGIIRLFPCFALIVGSFIIYGVTGSRRAA
ncbi:MAG: hypothetical protein DLM73_03005 [Chthoniobacterales bacterium]|nr:MAG: hypothetical protein DLM73_03005 [Chthoniobacterales bacterium]